MLDIAIIVIYFIVMAAIGIYDYRRRKISTTSGFFVINRRGTTLDIVGSLCATLIGASATLGMAGLAYTRGLSGSWWLLAGVVGLFILGFFFARRVRSAGLYTLPELVEKQYNSKTAGFVASILILVAWLAVIAAQILASGKILAVLFPSVDISTWMIITASVVTFYTFLGGQYSVIGTDIIQFGIIIIGVFVGAGLVLNHAGGASGLHASLPSGFFSFPLSPNLNFGWLDFMSLLILVGATYVVGPDMYSRLFCARDEKVARKSAFIAGLVTIPIAFGIVVIGMGAKALFPAIPSEQAFPQVIKDVLPIGVSGLVGAALLAAMMS
ncbi:MAG: sodium:solute symporter family protein, partial [Chloroflexi bacterium]|nr:sodium:solute symporter family protein [Chloroflexota bacterium]